MTIRVYVKHVYGKELIYPACEQANVIRMLTGTVTLTKQHIEAFKLLGHDVKLVHNNEIKI